MGGDISQHHSQDLTAELVEEADLILAMTKKHVDYMHENHPQYRENVFLLKRFGLAGNDATNQDDPDNEEIFDPIGSDKETYRTCAHIIDKELERIMPTLIHFIQERRRSSQEK
jgi:protein-tyrosine phosphatase